MSGGLVICKGGETIKSINQLSGAHVEFDRNAPPDAQEKNFVIQGSAEAVERVKNMVLEKTVQSRQDWVFKLYFVYI